MGSYDPGDLHAPMGSYPTKPAANHSMGEYVEAGHDFSFQCVTGWISLPVAYNFNASAAQESTVRVKLFATQYTKIQKYRAKRNSRPPMIPDLDNTNKATMNPTSLSLSASGQQPPVLQGFSYTVSAPHGTGSGESSTFTSELQAEYSIGKEKLFLETSDVSLGSISETTTPVQFGPKLPIDGNEDLRPVNILPQYTFSAIVGPGQDAGAFYYAGGYSDDPYGGM